MAVPVLACVVEQIEAVIVRETLWVLQSRWLITSRPGGRSGAELLPLTGRALLQASDQAVSGSHHLDLMNE